MSFACDTCFDTMTIDHGGREVPCPYCGHKLVKTVKLTGLGWGLGEDGFKYDTVSEYTRSTMTFVGYESAILNDVRRVRLAAEGEARQRRLTGRNTISSGAIAIENRVRKALNK